VFCRQVEQGSRAIVSRAKDEDTIEAKEVDGVGSFDIACRDFQLAHESEEERD